MKKSKYSLLLLLVAMLSACSIPAAGAGQPAQQATATSISATVSSPVALPTITFALPVGMPTIETDFNTTLSTLQSGKFSYMANLAQEKYDASASSTPGTLTYTVSFPASETIYLNYGWCAIDATTLQQNIEHIAVLFYFNAQQIPGDYVTTLSSKADNLECTNAGILLSGWQPGTYQFRVVAMFDEKINDGISDYQAGDYISEYQVTVQ